MELVFQESKNSTLHDFFKDKKAYKQTETLLKIPAEKSNRIRANFHDFFKNSSKPSIRWKRTMLQPASRFSLKLNRRDRFIVELSERGHNKLIIPAS